VLNRICYTGNATSKMPIMPISDIIFTKETLLNFYCAMLRRARYCSGKLSVGLSVYPSVTLVDCDRIRWDSRNIIPQFNTVIYVKQDNVQRTRSLPNANSNALQDISIQIYSGPSPWPFRVTWLHLIPQVPFPIGALLQPILYLQLFSR